MNTKKTLAVLASLSFLLAACAAFLSLDAAAQTLPARSSRHSLQTDVSQSLGPAVPESPLPSLASSTDVEIHPNDVFRLKILVKNSGGEPAPGARLFISLPNSGEEPAEIRADDSRLRCA